MSFREMRRKDRQVFDDSMTDIMEKGEFGVLSLQFPERCLLLPGGQVQALP